MGKRAARDFEAGSQLKLEDIKVKFFVDAYGDVALFLLRELRRDFALDNEQLFVRTYDLDSNHGLLGYIRENKITYSLRPYDEAMVSRIQAFRPDVVLSLFGRVLIPNGVYGESLRTMNIHPSLLPKYAGCFSVPWSIIHGERQTGVTFHQLSHQFDRGDIIEQHVVPIEDTDTALSLYSKINNKVCERFSSALRRYICGELIPINKKLHLRLFSPKASIRRNNRFAMG